MRFYEIKDRDFNIFFIKTAPRFNNLMASITWISITNLRFFFKKDQKHSGAAGLFCPILVVLGPCASLFDQNFYSYLSGGRSA